MRPERCALAEHPTIRRAPSSQQFLRGGKGLLVVVLHVLLYVVMGFLVLVHSHLLMPSSSLCRANMKSEIGLRFLSHS